MTMNSANSAISLGGATIGESINLEIQQPATQQVSFNDTLVRQLAQVTTPNSQISMPVDFWGKSYGTQFTYLIVGGGGGGGTGYAGGGGGGGAVVTGVTGIIQNANTVSYTMTVGSGGASGANGTDSSFVQVAKGISVTALGGGAGGTNGAAGAAGGSGGGGSAQVVAAGTAGTGGNAGGTGVVDAAVDNNKVYYYYTGSDQTTTIPATFTAGGIVFPVINATIELWGAGGYGGYTRIDAVPVGTTYHVIPGSGGSYKIGGAMDMYWSGNYYGYGPGGSLISTIWPYDGSLDYIGAADDSDLVAVSGAGYTPNGYGGGLVGGNGSGYAGVSGGTQTGPGNAGDGRGGAYWSPPPGKLTGGTWHGGNGCTLSHGAGGYYPGGGTNVDPCVGQPGGGGSGFLNSTLVTGLLVSLYQPGYIAPPAKGQGGNGLIVVTYNY